MTRENKILFLLGSFVGLLVLMNLVGGKIINFFGVSVSVAIFLTPVTFLITDIVGEACGRETSKTFLKIGMIVLFFSLAFVGIALWLPPAERYTLEPEFQKIFGVGLRSLVASVIAFFLSQANDILLFHFMKKKTAGRALWLRNNLSTVVSQTIDTFVFMFIAFYQITPQFNAFFIVQLTLPYLALKILFAALDTPFVYAGVRWLQAPEK